MGRVAVVAWMVPCLLLAGAARGADPGPPPYEPKLPAPALSGQVPRVVPVYPLQYSGVQQRPFFDVFAWQSFIALAWPADPGRRGVPYRPDDPAAFADYADGRVPVWMTWKESFDLFPEDGSAPRAWDSPDAYSPVTCRNVERKPGQVLLARVSKFNSVADEVNEAFGGPLVDQTGLFIRYEVRINRPEYDFVRDNGYYRQANWPSGGLYLPASNGEKLGSIEVKAAWRDLSKVEERFHHRFFVTEALAVEPKTCTGSDDDAQPTQCDCTVVKAGLVGLHIAHKTEQFPQWVWATFEQADNLGDDAVTPTPLDMTPSLYDPEAYRKHPGVPRVNPAAHPGSSRVPAGDDFDATPINVVRLSQIPTTPQTSSGRDVSTLALNQIYRQGVLADSVWQYYFLVGSQWSTLPSAPFMTPQPYVSPPDFGCEDGAAPAVGGVPFPQCLLSNTTMETYHQYDSCQNCHQGAQRAGADFSWVLANRSTPKTTSGLQSSH